MTGKAKQKTNGGPLLAIKDRGSRLACAVKVSFWLYSAHHKLPRLIELNQLPTQSLNLISYLQILCLVEFKSESVHSHFEQDANRVTDAGEGSSKHLLLDPPPLPS
jgi:hypothetical protein